MTLEHIRLFLNEHMKKDKVVFACGSRECTLQLCGSKYSKKLDLYLALEQLESKSRLEFLWWLSMYSKKLDHLAVTSVALVFKNIRGDYTCTYYHNGRYVKLDAMDEIFEFTSNIVPDYR